jgi:hypothetical protein
VGACFEPFLQRLHHRCEPNTIFRFEGRELQLRAAKPIPAKHPLSIYITRDGEDATSVGFPLNCTCDPDPEIPVCKTYMHFLQMKTEQEKVERSIAEPEKYQDRLDALRSLLSMVFVAGPEPTVSIYERLDYISRYDRLDNLSGLASIFAMLYTDLGLFVNPEAKKLFAATGMEWSLEVPLFLRQLHYQGSSKWHGQDSAMARVSKENFDHSITLAQKLYDKAKAEPPELKNYIEKKGFALTATQNLINILIHFELAFPEQQIITLESLGL